ncbi:hypothetical protein W04_1275 [Pseudoalteromonas sp. SW0106-04]|nr:hypothetical protein W04_1275 [Pseudoalteromonas sp. SW0106-04]
MMPLVLISQYNEQLDLAYRYCYYARRIFLAALLWNTNSTQTQHGVSG